MPFAACVTYPVGERSHPGQSWERRISPGGVGGEPRTRGAQSKEVIAMPVYSVIDMSNYEATYSGHCFPFADSYQKGSWSHHIRW